MASFASVEDLEAYLGVTFNEAEESAQAQAMLDQATGEMVSYMGGQTIVEATDTGIKLDPNNNLIVVLPQFPVTAVTAVAVDGTTLTVADDVDWYASGIMKRRNDASWGWKRQSVVVTYKHGYATIPPDLMGVCRARAARLLDNPTAVSNEAADTYSGNYGPAVDEAFTKAEMRIMDRYGDVASA